MGGCVLDGLLVGWKDDDDDESLLMMQGRVLVAALLAVVVLAMAPSAHSSRFCHPYDNVRAVQHMHASRIPVLQASHDCCCSARLIGT